MTFNVLVSVVKGIVGFVQEYGSFGASIDVEDVGLGSVGGCLLTFV